ncbi:class I SAM-dependent methyltransferase [Sporomusa aerivorans]|uniref:tRNA (mnm(5)s(2)U34)-methyltransferase n=1 Tax=Sporomusa aerivorans TaxID=204936 RepID=UPI00352B9CD6
MVVANAVRMAHQFILPRLANARTVVDATAGNGNDTLFLAENTPDATTVFAFDIQQQGLSKTETLLTGRNLRHKVRLILDSHSHLNKYLHQQLDAVMFNLGYLPGSDHKLSTNPATTIEAAHQALQLLNIGGVMTIAVYPGYEHGRLECQAVYEYLAILNQKVFSVACWSMVNQKNNPPLLYVIEKIRSEPLEGITSLKD